MEIEGMVVGTQLKDGKVISLIDVKDASSFSSAPLAIEGQLWPVGTRLTLVIVEQEKVPIALGELG